MRIRARYAKPGTDAAYRGTETAVYVLQAMQVGSPPTEFFVLVWELSGTDIVGYAATTPCAYYAY
eukprot:1444249-Rhodomonas_salina.2